MPDSWDFNIVDGTEQPDAWQAEQVGQVFLSIHFHELRPIQAVKNNDNGLSIFFLIVSETLFILQVLFFHGYFVEVILYPGILESFAEVIVDLLYMNGS